MWVSVSTVDKALSIAREWIEQDFEVEISKSEEGYYLVIAK